MLEIKDLRVKLADEVKPPDPGSAPTARERYARHSEDPVCSGCHSMMDPVGLAFENYDPVGLWRDTENGVTIDDATAGERDGYEITTRGARAYASCRSWRGSEDYDYVEIDLLAEVV